MRILLVNPPYTEVYGKYKYAARVGVLYPPLGLMYLASSLEQDENDVKILDCELENGYKEFPDYIRRYAPHIIGITSTTPLHHLAMELFNIIKKINKRIVTVCGGAHTTALGAQVLGECESIDIACIGEGEITIKEICKNIDNLSEVEGIIYRDGVSIVKNPPRKLIEDIDEIPFPARHLVKLKEYRFSVPGKGIVPITPIRTTRGCPYKCVFCSQHCIFGHGIRSRSIDNIIKELNDIIYNHKINDLIFYDDTFGLNKKLIYELADVVRRKKLRFTIEGWTRADVIDDKFMSELKTIGLTRLSIGVESGNQHILDAIRKGTSLEKIREAYEIASKYGIETKMSIIFGLPFETKKTIRETIRFMKSLRCYQAYVNVATPFPGTEFYTMAKNGYGGLRLLTNDWRKFRRWGNAVISVNDLGRKDLIRWQKRALIEFYLTPKRMIYNLKRAGLKAAAVNVISAIKSFTSWKV